MTYGTLFIIFLACLYIINVIYGFIFHEIFFYPKDTKNDYEVITVILNWIVTIIGSIYVFGFIFSHWNTLI